MLSRCCSCLRSVASLSRSSAIPSSTSSLPFVGSLSSSRRSLHSSLTLREETAFKVESASGLSSLRPSTTSASPTTSTSKHHLKSAAIFTAVDKIKELRQAKNPPNPIREEPPTRLREHLRRWAPFKELDEDKQAALELKIRKKAKAACQISVTMAKWYSDPIPYLFPPPKEMFGVERQREQQLEWFPRVGDRVCITPIMSYGMVTAIRPAAPSYSLKKRIKKLEREAASSTSPFSRDEEEDDEDESNDPTWRKDPSTSDVQKLDIEMPPDWVLMQSKDGPSAGVVEKKLAEDEAKRVLSREKPKVASIGKDVKSVKEEAFEKSTKMCAEIRLELYSDSTVEHSVSSLLFAPLSPSNLTSLASETGGHHSIPAAQDSGYLPSPTAIEAVSWNESSPPKGPHNRRRPSSPRLSSSREGEWEVKEKKVKVDYRGANAVRAEHLRRQQAEMRMGGTLDGAARRVMRRNLEQAGAFGMGGGGGRQGEERRKDGGGEGAFGMAE